LNDAACYDSHVVSTLELSGAAAADGGDAVALARGETVPSTPTDEAATAACDSSRDVSLALSDGTSSPLSTATLYYSPNDTTSLYTAWGAAPYGSTAVGTSDSQADCGGVDGDVRGSATSDDVGGGGQACTGSQGSAAVRSDAAATPQHPIASLRRGSAAAPDDVDSPRFHTPEQFAVPASYTQRSTSDVAAVAWPDYDAEAWGAGSGGSGGGGDAGCYTPSQLRHAAHAAAAAVSSPQFHTPPHSLPVGSSHHWSTADDHSHAGRGGVRGSGPGVAGLSQMHKAWCDVIDWPRWDGVGVLVESNRGNTSNRDTHTAAPASRSSYSYNYSNGGGRRYYSAAECTSSVGGGSGSAGTSSCMPTASLGAHTVSDSLRTLSSASATSSATAHGHGGRPYYAGGASATSHWSRHGDATGSHGAGSFGGIAFAGVRSPVWKSRANSATSASDATVL
jgi:hypothetical protein